MHTLDSSRWSVTQPPIHRWRLTAARLLLLFLPLFTSLVNIIALQIPIIVALAFLITLLR
jgi:hypothetical protein